MKWVEHNGMGRPVNPDTLVHCRFRSMKDDTQYPPYRADMFEAVGKNFDAWVDNGRPDDIMAYMVASDSDTQPKDGDAKQGSARE